MVAPAVRRLGRPGPRYIASGILQAQSSERDSFPLANAVIGVLWILNGGAQYLIDRRRLAKERSAETQVEDRAEAGRPGTGG